MKKLYNVTLRGYYVMSVILGFILALSVGMALEVTVLDASWAVTGAMEDVLDKVWCFLPLGVCDFFYYHGGYHWQYICMVVTAIMAVSMFVQMAGTAKSRTKILQTVATALFVLFLLMAFRWAIHATYYRKGALALVPVFLMVIPLMILRNTQREVKRSTETEASPAIAKPVDTVLAIVKEATSGWRGIFTAIKESRVPVLFGAFIGVVGTLLLFILGFVATHVSYTQNRAHEPRGQVLCPGGG